MPMDMRLLLTLLEAIKRVFTYEKGKSDSYEKSEKSSNKDEKEKKCPGVPFFWPGFPRKSTLRSVTTCVRNMGVHIPRTTLMIVGGLKRTERRNPISVPPRKVDIRVIP